MHDRVPENYPPLPDIFLDNITHIPWAFQVTECIILALSVMFTMILLFHKHRLVIFKRFAAITGSVFLLRCFTMFVTSLSVPGIHLDCSVQGHTTIEEKVKRAFNIFIYLGLSINGVQTCGDYMCVVFFCCCCCN